MLLFAINRNASETPESAHADDAASISTQATGALAANAFAGFTSPILKIQAPTGIKSAVRNDGSNNTVCLQSTYSCRDSEIVTWMQKGWLLLRVSGTTALYVNWGIGGATQLRCGIITGVSSDLNSGATAYVRDSSILDLTTVSGWSSSYTAGDTYTFGCVGFDVYVKYKGVEILRFKEYRLNQAGTAAIYDASGGNVGVFDPVIHYLPATLKSNRSLSILDGRDFGAKTTATTGSITSGQSTLTVASASGFAIGDSIIVATGSEAALGARGTVGVGGVWPSLSYANTTAMNADLSKAANTWAWDRSSGLNYYYTGSAWALVTTVYNINFYYLQKALPKALRAKITGIAGSVLTLDTAASATTTNATVYADNASAFYPLTDAGTNDNYPSPSGLKLRFPTGTFALGSAVTGTLKPSFQINGAGRTATKFLSPKGCIGLSITIDHSDNAIFQNFAVQGNHTIGASGEQDGFQLVVDPTLDTWLNNAVTLGMTSVVNGTVQNVDVVDVMTWAITFRFCTNTWGYNCTYTHNYKSRGYMQWFMSTNNGTNDGYQDCTVSSPWLIKSFETFNGVGATFRRCGGTNVLCSTNSSGGYLYDGFFSNIANNSFDSVDGQQTGFYHEPVINVNANAFHGSSNLALGGTITNPKIIQTGFCEPTNKETIVGINIPAECINVTVTGQYPGVSSSDGPHGGFFSAPNYAVVNPAKAFATLGPRAVLSDATGTVVTGVRSVGTMKSGSGNIELTSTATGGTVQNSVADALILVSGTTQSGNVNNATYVAAHP